MATEHTNNLSNHQAPTEPPTTTLTIRMIMQGKEAGSIIGKKGDNVKKFREESGAKINISDASCPERIVTVTGGADHIFKAFTMISKKFEEDIQTTHQNSSLPRPPVTVRLVVPASQCGSLIGKGGSKIKEIREVTGASVQVASEMLPNSTERAVTISGNPDSITQCIYHICCVMIESPPKGATIPYRPKPAMPPVIVAGGQAFTVQGQYAIPQPDPRASLMQYGAAPQLTKMATQHGILQPGIPLMATQGGMIPAGMMGAMAAFPRPHAPATPNNAQTHEMTIPNDLIGCIIGRGGAKINEIRQLSGATIKIANAEEGTSDRKVTITGTPDTINAAQYLINASLELHKTLTLDPNSNPTSTTALTSAPNPMAIPMSQILKPVPLLGLGSVGLFEHKNFAAKFKGGIMIANATKKNGNRFAPY